MLRIPEGSVGSYQQLADATGHPRAVQAAGGAVARNAVAYVIPCHRVIRKTGVRGGYRWDPVRKQALLAWESARPCAG
jgi:AraC family transcriptional regulator of adaptative response/methylated-DNA-[protein]-cysteine methyltransferase